jgi:2-iminobutanoate/2-iminopropanoate deaminase
MKEIVKTENAPAAIGPYSQGTKIDNLVFTAGQIGMSPVTGELVKGGVAAETERALLNISAVLEAAGSSLQKVVKTTVFLNDLQDLQKMNGVYEQFFGDSLPARSTVQAVLPKGASVEVEAIAVID